jgi:hypothetical protein
MDWIFQLPILVLFPAVMGTFVGATLAGMMMLAPVRRRMTERFARSSEQAAYFGTQIWLVYSLILSLVAVGAWTDYQAAGEKVSREISTLEVLQRKATVYPEPMRTQMDGLIRDYARAVASEEWPEQRAGRVPGAGRAYFQKLADVLGDFEPTNLPDQMVHAETLRELTSASEARRARIHASASSLPTVVWLVVLAGAVLALGGATFFVQVDDQLLHMTLVAIMAAFVGLVVFVTIALDHPFQGSVTPSDMPFRTIASQPFVGT